MKKTLHLIAKVLVVVGALNWGLIAAFNYDVVASLLGTMTTASKIVYGLVGLSGLWMLVDLFKGR